MILDRHINGNDERRIRRAVARFIRYHGLHVNETEPTYDGQQAPRDLPSLVCEVEIECEVQDERRHTGAGWGTRRDTLFAWKRVLARALGVPYDRRLTVYLGRIAYDSTPERMPK